MLDIAREREIRVTVFASPFHIEYWNILKKHGLYEQHQLWLKDLTDQLSEYEGIVEFWDLTMEIFGFFQTKLIDCNL